MTATVCMVHHYILESPHGPTLSGTCKHCGDVRVYQADLEEQMQPWRQSAQRNAVRESRKAAERAKDAQKTTMVWRD